MLFNSYIFIFLFFPLCMGGYFLLNKMGKPRVGKLFLLGMSLWFYGYFNPEYLLIILGSVVVNFCMVRLMERTSDPTLRKWELAAAILGNVGILFYYKYLDFTIVNLNAVLNTAIPLRNILLPLGISFFTFQQISYVVDAYRGEVGAYGLLDYMTFVCYFPQLVAGPIVTHDELIPQLQDPERHRFDWDSFSRGLFLFSLGLGKKVLLADMFGKAVNWGFGNVERLDSTNALLTMLGYTFQVYFDFSGYSDMAVGLGKMMHLELPTNFDSPYKACNIRQFWDRWHMTLTRFLTKYVYIPLGGSRKGLWRTCLNVMVVFLLSGIWHGANWTFILWGGLHGLASVLTRCMGKIVSKIPRPIGWLFTFAFINLTWVLFRADSISQAFTFFGRLFSMEFGPVSAGIQEAFALSEIVLPCYWVLNTDFTLHFPNLVALQLM